MAKDPAADETAEAAIRRDETLHRRSVEDLREHAENAPEPSGKLKRRSRLLAFKRALGEFGATITFAGNFPGTTRTMPLEIYTARQTDEGAALVLSVILLVISVAVLAGLRERWIGGTQR